MYKHTLCFIKRNEEILMLNREYAPVKGLWNGVGGKIEKGETPLENTIREIKEETNIKVTYDQIQLFLFIELNKYIDFTMNLLVREGL